MPTCDGCGKKCKEGSQVYKLQLSQRAHEDSIKGVFIKANNDADLCNTCFLNMCKNGYKPNWVKLQKNEQTGKWTEIDEQTKLNE